MYTYGHTLSLHDALPISSPRLLQPETGDGPRPAGAVGLLVRAAADRRPATVQPGRRRPPGRSDEHTSELQSLMRRSYAVFCLKKKTQHLILRTKSNVDYYQEKQHILSSRTEITT